MYFIFINWLKIEDHGRDCSRNNFSVMEFFSLLYFTWIIIHKRMLPQFVNWLTFNITSSEQLVVVRCSWDFMYIMLARLSGLSLLCLLSVLLAVLPWRQPCPTFCNFYITSIIKFIDYFYNWLLINFSLHGDLMIFSLQISYFNVYKC